MIKTFFFLSFIISFQILPNTFPSKRAVQVHLYGTGFCPHLIKSKTSNKNIIVKPVIDITQNNDYQCLESEIHHHRFHGHWILAEIINQIKNNKLPIEITPVIKDFDGKPLKGPNSMILSEKNNCLFFTDSGPLGETSIESPLGSVFAIDLSVSMLKPVIDGKLAHPSGIALSTDENESMLYVSETGMNRILRIVSHPSGVYHTGVFH